MFFTSDEDIDPFYQILNEANVLRYFPESNAPSRSKVEKIVFSTLNHWKDHGYGLWAITSRQNGSLIGRSGLQYLPETSEVEVDFLLGESYWGQGIATLAGQISVNYGCKALGLKNIVGIVHPDNKASQRVLIKIGMQFEEEANYFGMDCFKYTLYQTEKSVLQS